MFAMASPYDERAAIIEEWMDRLRVSTHTMAEMISVKSHVSIGEWLKGEKNPRDKTVWQRMLDALAKYELELRRSGARNVIFAGRLTIPLLDANQDAPLSVNNKETSVYMKSIVIADPNNGRNHWARTVQDAAMGNEAKPGDVLVFDDRDPEPGHAVDAFVDGKSYIRVLLLEGEIRVLRSVAAGYPDIPFEKAVIRGVVALKVESKGGGISVTTTYEFGMRPELRR